MARTKILSILLVLVLMYGTFSSIAGAEEPLAAALTP